MRLPVFILLFTLLSCGQTDKKKKEIATIIAAADTMKKNNDPAIPPVSAPEKSSLKGTYKMKNGEASCTITVDDSTPEIKFTVFAWWGTASGRHGEITGTGTIDKNNNCQINMTDKMSENSECSPSVTFTKTGFIAVFKNCGGEYNVPEDFSGDYKKISPTIEEN